MARTKKAEVEVVETGIDTPQATHALQTLQQSGAAMINQVAQQLEQTDYSRAAAITTIQGLMANASLVMYEIGRVLCWVRANEPAEEFVALLDQVGMEKRLAQKLMQTFRKFSAALTDEQRDRVLGLGRSKLLELVALDDDELQELAEGESDLGTIDEVDAMSTSELRAAIRREREQRIAEGEAKQKRLDDRNRRIDVLENELEKLQHGTKDEKARAARAAERYAIEQVQGATLALLVQVEAFDVAIADVLEQAALGGANAFALRLAANQSLTYAFQRIADISKERGMEVDFQEVVEPAWLKAISDKPTEQAGA